MFNVTNYTKLIFLTGIALSQRRLILLHWYHSLHVVHSIQLESVRQVFCICSTLQSIQYTLSGQLSARFAFQDTSSSAFSYSSD